MKASHSASRDIEARRDRPTGRTRLWLATGPIALAVLFWSCRGALLGVSVADDYAFLDRLAFQHPLDWFDSMGASYYWRPVSRQLYFTLLGPVLLEAPWIVPAFHAALLLAIYAFAYRVARRAFDVPVAAMLAAFPLAAEPARALLGWASGGQHLLALLGITIAVHESVAGRIATASLAALAGTLCHENAALVLPAMPVLAGFATRRRSAVLGTAGAAALVGTLVWVGHVLARSHGMMLPSDVGAAPDPGRIGAALGRALVAGLDLEDLPPGIAWPIACAGVVALAAGVVRLARAAVRARVAAAAPVWLGGALWFAATAAPLAWVLPDWNGWRTIVPAAGLGVALMAWLGTISVPLAASVFALRLAALAFAPPAPAVVEARPPASVSQSSFPRLARMRRTVESTRAALTTRFPSLPHGSTVRYWLIPALTEIGFQGPRALRVWYADSTLSWEPFMGAPGLRQRTDALIEYNASEPLPATVIEPAAIALFAGALDAMAAADLPRADSLLAACFRAQPIVSEPFFASLAYNQARVAIARGQPVRAESLAQLDRKWAGESARYHAVRARIAAARGEREAAGKELERALTLDASNADAIALARELGFISDH
jgi:hypothetical protein